MVFKFNLTDWSTLENSKFFFDNVHVPYARRSIGRPTRSDNMTRSASFRIELGIPIWDVRGQGRQGRLHPTETCFRTKSPTSNNDRNIYLKHVNSLD